MLRRMPLNLRAALYMRLSKDDEGQFESSSIQNQRQILIRFAQAEGFQVVEEYVDDGFSGTNFDRPAFQRMLADVDRQRFDLILLKDLSRLGRDYIQTGRYTEEVFPAKRIRVIAVNDGFDSQRQNDFAPFQHVVNEMYARDTSKKIRSAFAAKMEQGSFIGNFAPYGYEKDPLNKNHLVPDPMTASLVGEIFQRAAAGEPPLEIAAWLNQAGHPAPLAYRAIKYGTMPGTNSSWTAAAVTRILHNRVYLGEMAQGKTTKLSFKSKLVLRNAPSDWVVVPHTHQPLTDPSAYDLAEQQLRHRRRTPYPDRISSQWKGFAVCADCHQPMSSVGSRKKGSPIQLVCATYKRKGKTACTNHFIDDRLLSRLVQAVVRQQLQLNDQERTRLLSRICRLQKDNPSQHLPAERERYQRELKQTTVLIGRLYQDYAADRISQEQFDQLLQQYEAKTKQWRRQVEQMAIQSPLPSLEQMAAWVDNVLQNPQPVAPLLQGMIERIEIGQGGYVRGTRRRVKRQSLCIMLSYAVKPQVLRYTDDMQ